MRQIINNLESSVATSNGINRHDTDDTAKASVKAHTKEKSAIRSLDRYTSEHALSAWFGGSVNEDGRICFRGSKIAIKVGKLHRGSIKLAEMLKIIKKCQKKMTSAQIKFSRKPTQSYLRQNFTCIALIKSAENRRVDRDFSIVLYDNGWLEYWSTCRTTTLYLPDCLNFIYNYNCPIDDIKTMSITQPELENIEWSTVASLFAEEQLTYNMAISISNNSDANADVNADTKSEQENPVPDKEPKQEIISTVHIPTPEERMLRQERQQGMQKIIKAAVASLSRKQSEIYVLYFEYGYSLKQCSEILQVPFQTLGHRITTIREKFAQELKKQTGEDACAFFSAYSHGSKNKNINSGENHHVDAERENDENDEIYEGQE